MRSPLFAACGLALACTAAEPARPQNVVLVLADDLGFSDFGCYGSEIATPNVDRLAAEGLRFRQAYVTGRCCPTRACLLTGAWAHQAGMGWMTRLDLGRPAYCGDLSRATPTIPEVLRPAGHASGLFGKWHVAQDRRFAKGSTDRVNWPLDRGFDAFVGGNGGGNYWLKNIFEGNSTISFAEPVYFTELIGDRAAGWIREQASAKRPFFAYVAFTAPHFPLQAPAADIAAQGRRYEEGWEPVRLARLERQRELGVLPRSATASPPGDDIPSFSALGPEDRADMALRMRIYAAQVASLDANLGKVLRALEETGTLADTAVIVLSDNGATEEDFPTGRLSGEAGRGRGCYRRPWANVSNAPFARYKRFMHEGGIRTPLIVRWPAGIPVAGGWSDQVAHAVDILPTVAGICGAPLPPADPRIPGVWPAGRDLRPALAGAPPQPRTLWFEHEGNRAIRDGELKLAALAGRPWELYDLAADPCETRDLAAQRPGEVQRLDAAWTALAGSCGALPLDLRSWEQRVDDLEKKTGSSSAARVR